MLADTLSRLIEVNSDVKLPEEEEGHEFGYVPFEQLPPAQVEVLEEILINEVTNDKVTIQHDTPIQKDIEIELPLTNQKMRELQEQDPKVSHLRKMWSQGKLNRNVFIMENDILRKMVMINGLLYKPVVTPSILKDCLLMLAHDQQGHNRFKRTYAALQQVYFWKGMKRQIQLHCRRCRICQRYNMRTQEFYKKHFAAPSQPMEFIAMDLIGEFHPASSKGNRYALTVICMLTGFTFCIPLRNKTAEEVVKAYLNHVCCTFGPSRKILTDNGTEFKNKMWDAVYEILKTEHKVTPIYSPQCNGRIEGFHRFLKATAGKQLQKGLEWDDVVWKATSAYNFFPTESSGNSPFFLMFRCEAAAKHLLLEEESTKYVGDDQGILNLKLMQQLYHVVAYNLAKSRAARDGNTTKENEPRKIKNFRPKELKQSGLVLVRDHTLGAFEPRGKDHHIVDFSGNYVTVKDNHGTIKTVHRKDIQPVEMDIATAEFYRKERKKATKRDAKHVMPIKQIPDLNWKFDENINQVTSKNPEMGKHGEHSPHMPEITGSAPEENEKKVEVLKETTPEETDPIKTSQTKEEIKAGSNPNSQIEGTEQVEAATQTTDPERAAEPIGGPKLPH